MSKRFVFFVVAAILVFSALAASPGQAGQAEKRKAWTDSSAYKEAYAKWRKREQEIYKKYPDGEGRFITELRAEQRLLADALRKIAKPGPKNYSPEFLGMVSNGVKNIEFVVSRKELRDIIKNSLPEEFRRSIGIGSIWLSDFNTRFTPDEMKYMGMTVR